MIKHVFKALEKGRLGIFAENNYGNVSKNDLKNIIVALESSIYENVNEEVFEKIMQGTSLSIKNQLDYMDYMKNI